VTKYRQVALCADDYGLSFGVSVGILKALSAGRLTAVSAIVTGVRWPAMGRDLIRNDPDADLGLHLNLTLGRPLGPMATFAPQGKLPSVSAVIRQSVLGRLPVEEIRAEIDRQLDRFEAVIGRPPDHVDGHHHVHMFKGVREPLLQALVARGLAGRVWLRNAGDAPHRIALRRTQARKALSVRSLGAGFGRAAQAQGFTLNDGFAGFSSFRSDRDYARAFETYLRAPGRRHLVMCHPGHVDEDLKAQDAVTITREQELAFLLSPRLPEMLERRNMRLARLSTMGG
jgi:predicted glycoside hydrolase/deacetylase ChbG (UPF0249 family)